MNKKKIIISTVSGILALTISSSIAISLTKNSKLNKESPYESSTIVTFMNEDIQTSKSSEPIEFVTESLTNTDIEDVSSATESFTEVEPTVSFDKGDYNDDFDVIDYTKCLQQLNNILDEKKFPSEANDIFISLFDNIYKNYDKAYNVYKISNVPTRNEYLSTFFLSIKHLGGVKISNSPNTTPTYSHITNVMTIGNASDHGMQHEVAHELCHVYQDMSGQLTKANVQSKKLSNSGLYCILFEGDGDYVYTFLNDSISNEGNSFVNNGNNSFKIRGKDYNYSYNVASVFNYMFTNLTSYDDMQNFKKNFDQDEITKTISDKYGFDASLFVKKCCSVSKAAYWQKTNSEVFNDLNYIFNTYLECCASKIDKLDSAEDVKDFANGFRYFLMQEMPVYLNYSSDDLYSEIETHFSVDIVKNKLYEKCNSYGVITDKAVFDTVFDVKSSLDTKNNPISLDGAIISYRNGGFDILSGDFIISNDNGYVSYSTKADLDHAISNNIKPLFDNCSYEKR